MTATNLDEIKDLISHRIRIFVQSNSSETKNTLSYFDINEMIDITYLIIIDELITEDVEVNEGKITLKAQGKRKKDYSILHTVRSLIKNICEGLTEGYTIKMKVVYAHFPVTVKVKDKIILIENFQGERAARTTRIVGNTKVNPKGEDVILTGEVWTDITQTAANIALKTKVKDKDHRVFLDGIYIYEKKKGIEK